MRTDVSRLSFDEGNHFVAVFQQMGRLPLDADFNEQNELMLRLVQRLAGDSVHTGSPNEGFRVDTRLLIDRLDSRRGWSATPAAAASFVDHFDFRVGDGSLVVSGATALSRTLPRPLDLSGLREAQIAVKGTFNTAKLALTLTDSAGTSHSLTMSEPGAEDGWRLFRALPGSVPPAFKLAEIAGYAFTALDSGQRYAFDFLKVDLPLRTAITQPERAAAWSPTPTTATLALDDDNRIWGALSLKVTGATALTYALPTPLNLQRKRALRMALKRSPAGAALTLEVLDSATPPQSVALASAAVATLGGWEVVSFSIPQAGPANWASIAQLRLSGLSAGATYWFGPVQVEADPAADLVIMGGDGTAEGAGRFYGDGVSATKERHDTYTTQRDLPEPDLGALAPLAADSARIDWAYLDLWERPLTYIEKPALREPALEGLDTGTRTQLIAQVRLLAGQPVAANAEPPAPAAAFAALPRWGKGTLTTKDTPAAALDPCADPCEPALGGPYLGEENRLFRVEIHKAGDIGAANAAGTAMFKWSRDNGAVASALIADAAAGATSAQVEKPELFVVGDLVEISDDLVELVTGPAEDTLTHRNHLRGEMRRIMTVNLDARRVSWDNPLAPGNPLHAPLTRAMRLAYHAKITKWDGVDWVVAGDIALADGVTVEFGGRDLIPGDYWLFTTRTLDHSVERLIEAPPRGVRHAYYLLAALRRKKPDATTPESVIAEDLRPRFAPLPQLDASRVGFDPSFCADHAAVVDWTGVETVQQALEAICRADLNADLRLHHRLLHGYGVVCGLKMRCLMSDRTQAVLGGGYAIDCDGYTINVRGDKALPVVAQATAQGLLDSAGDGTVALVLERSTTQDADVVIEPYVEPDFWESVLEGTLIKDFIDDCFLALYNLVRQQLWPSGQSPRVPVPMHQRRILSLFNLYWAQINPSSGPYVFISKAEHDLLLGFYDTVRAKLQEETTFCGLFDNRQPFPAYPYPEPVGIETVFGWSLHPRMKLSPDGKRAYAYGDDNEIQVYDLTTKELAEILEFPGGTNVEVQDIAFEPVNGAEVYVVGTITQTGSASKVDSIFATASFNGSAHTWGSTSVVCDIRFARLATHSARPSALYATGRSASDPTKRGLYVLTPNAIPPTPPLGLKFKATGLIEINTAGDTAYVAVNGLDELGNDGDDFDRLGYVNLGANPLTLVRTPPNVINGNEHDDDLRFHAGDGLYATGTAPSQTAKTLYRFDRSNAAAAPGSHPIGAADPNRLVSVAGRNEVWVTCADDCKARVFQVAGGSFRNDFRVPAQISPIAIAASAGGSQVVVMNALGNTLNLIDVAKVTATAPPSYTSETANTLPQYHADAIQAFNDLASVLAQYIKDCFCDKFLVECHTCDPAKDRIYLGSIEIKAKRVHNICNFTRRHYAKSFRTWGYWLSTVPILPLIKRAFALFACKVL